MVWQMTSMVKGSGILEDLSEKLKDTFTTGELEPFFCNWC